MTVPVDACSCGDLAQLVFEIHFPLCSGDEVGCDDCLPRFGFGLEYMAGTELWNTKRVNTEVVSDWVNIEYGVAEGVGGISVPYGRLVVYMDSPAGEAAVKAGCGPIMWLMFRVCDETYGGYGSVDLDASVIYATGMNGIEAGSAAEDGVVYIDDCNWLLDVDSNGRVEAETDGVILYRALKYGHIIDGCGPIVPIVPPEYDAQAGDYLPCDSSIVQYAVDVLGLFDLNVDDKADGIVDAIGGAAVSASRDGVYIYRNLAAFPYDIYPRYTPPAAYSPFVNPWVPLMASYPIPNVNLTVPAGHTDNLAAEDAINDQIDVLKRLWCGGDPQIPVNLPCWWMVDTNITLPLPQPTWSPCYAPAPP